MTPPPRAPGMTAAELRTLLVTLGITQIEAAEKLGYSKSQVNRWCMGTSVISVAVATHIRATLKTA